MRFLLMILFLAAIVIAQDLFSTDSSSVLSPFLLDDVTGEYDSTGDQDVSESSSLPIASLDFSTEQEVASCLGESSDSIPWSRKLRARDACPASNQPVPFKGSLPDWLRSLGDRLNNIFFDDDYYYLEDEKAMQSLTGLVSNRCEQPYQFNLCCLTQGSWIDGVYKGIDVYTLYEGCRKCM